MISADDRSEERKRTWGETRVVVGGGGGVEGV